MSETCAEQEGKVTFKDSLSSPLGPCICVRAEVEIRPHTWPVIAVVLVASPGLKKRLSQGFAALPRLALNLAASLPQPWSCRGDRRVPL